MAHPFTIALPSDVRSLEPGGAEDTFSFLVCHQVFEGLTSFAEGSTAIEPRLAESWSASADFRVWTFVLRRGLAFSDGSPLGAEQAAESLAHLEAAGVRIAVRGPHAIELTLPDPNPHLPEKLVQMANAIRKATPAGTIGSGPYRIASRKIGREIVLMRNERNDRFHPSIEEVVFRIVPFTALLAKGLIDGEIDLTDSVAPAILPTLRKAENVRIHCQMGLNTGFAALNTERPLLADRRIRAAIALAIDRAPLLQRFFPAGFGQAAVGLLPPTMFPANERPAPPFEPGRAGEALRAAGYRREAIRLRPSWAPRPYLPDPPGIAADIARMLRAAGFEITEEPPPSTAEYRAITARGDFDILLSGWIADDTLPVDFLIDTLHSSRVGKTNIARYSNPAFDDLLDRTRVSSDPAPASALAAAEAIIATDVPLVPLFHGPQIAAAGAHVRGRVLHPASALRIWDLAVDR